MTSVVECYQFNFFCAGSSTAVSVFTGLFQYVSGGIDQSMNGVPNSTIYFILWPRRCLKVTYGQQRRVVDTPKPATSSQLRSKTA